MIYFDLQDFNFWCYCEICHLNIQSVEVNTLKTLVHGLGKSSLTYKLNTFGVVSCARLVELPEQLLELLLAS